MILKQTLLCLAFGVSIFAEPLRRIPDELLSAFTERGEISVSYRNYSDNSYPRSEPLVYTTDMIEGNLKKIQQRAWSYYGATDAYLYEALEKYASWIEGKLVGIIGSATPWYESIIIHYGGHPVSIDYNAIISEDPRITTITVEEYEKSPITFDAVLSISSFEHDGLGRYGDPINPYGDYEAMKKTKQMLNKDGVLFLAVPVADDKICWNVHRVYGRVRLPKLLEGWSTIDSYGFCESNFDLNPLGYIHQPVFVLESIED